MLSEDMLHVKYKRSQRPYTVVGIYSDIIFLMGVIWEIRDSLVY